MNELHTNMLVLVLTNYDILPKTIEFKDERVKVDNLLYSIKHHNDIEALYKLNSEVLGRRGRLVRSKFNKDIH